MKRRDGECEMRLIHVTDLLSLGVIDEDVVADAVGVVPFDVERSNAVIEIRSGECFLGRAVFEGGSGDVDLDDDAASGRQGVDGDTALNQLAAVRIILDYDAISRGDGVVDIGNLYSALGKDGATGSQASYTMLRAADERQDLEAASTGCGRCGLRDVEITVPFNAQVAAESRNLPDLRIIDVGNDGISKGGRFNLEGERAALRSIPVGLDGVGAACSKSADHGNIGGGLLVEHDIGPAGYGKRNRTGGLASGSVSRQTQAITLSNHQVGVGRICDVERAPDHGVGAGNQPPFEIGHDGSLAAVFVERHVSIPFAVDSGLDALGLRAADDAC